MGWLPPHQNRLAGFCLLICLGLSATTQAATLYDPKHDWQTLFTPRFAVHFYGEGRNLAVRVGRIAEEELDRVGKLFGYKPDGRIEIVITDNADNANGSAQVLPKNIVRVFLTAPTELTGLSSYEDWLRLLVIHELAHICDIDQTWGWTRFLRVLFGKYIQWNGYTPQFLSEGAGVYAETMLSNTGRGRSSYVAMLLRMAALDDRFLKIDQGHVQFSDWPGPNSAYFYGGVFHLWLANKYGWESVRELHKSFASQLVPYVYYFGAKGVYGKSLPTLWEEWTHEEKRFAREVAENVKEKGITPSRRITFHGRNITGATYSPDGKSIIYSRTSPYDGSTVRQVNRDGTGDEFLVLQTFSPRFSFDPSGKAFYYSQNAINNRFNNYSDLYRYHLVEKKAEKLVDVDHPDTSLRASAPDVSSDGKRIVFVRNAWHQNWIALGTFDDEDPKKMKVRTLVPPQGDTQHASPKFSPDGKSIAVSTWFPGGNRDIVIIDAQTGEMLRRLTHDPALDGNPSWDRSGRYVLYESDADGISNIYAYDMETENYFRITRVIGGAFQADVSPNGRFLLFRNASGVGFDIHEMHFDPSSWISVAYDPQEGYIESPEVPQKEETWPTSWQPGATRAQEPDLQLQLDEHIEEYSPWRTILPFHDNWVLIPAVFFANNEWSTNATTLGSDVLAEHTYVLSAGTSYPTLHPNWSATYFNDVWYPTFAIGASDVATSFALNTDAGALRATRANFAASGSVTLPIKQRHLISTSYVYQQRRALNDIAGQFLTLGNTSWLQFGYAYSFARRFPFSVGLEHGKSISVAGRYYSTALGGDFDELLLTTDGRLYINNPLWKNHVFALRMVGAFAFGPDYRENFILGGAQGNSGISAVADSQYTLRGFPVDLAKYPPGIGAVAAYFEYRFPLWHVERGLWTVPFYMERFHLALFSDAGNTFGNGTESSFQDGADAAWDGIRKGRLGSGVELRADFNTGWAFFLTARLGAAFPLIQRGRYAPGAFKEGHYYFAFGTPI